MEQSRRHKNIRVSVSTSYLSHYTNTYKRLDRGVRLGRRKAYHVIHTGSSAFLTTTRCMHWFCGLILMPAPECHCAESTHATITISNIIITKITLLSNDILQCSIHPLLCILQRKTISSPPNPKLIYHTHNDVLIFEDSLWKVPFSRPYYQCAHQNPVGDLGLNCKLPFPLLNSYL